MAMRNPSPKLAEPEPAEPKPATRPRRQRKPDPPSVTAVNYRKTEKDVARLIDCLSEWERDLRAARSACPDVPPRRGRSRSDASSRVSTASPKPRYPRGNPLTDWMEFTDRNGAIWLAYIESPQPAPVKHLGSTSVLPDRHLRFDSATESRFTSLVPAGSPFLADARLQSLLDEAQPELPPATVTSAPARALSNPGYRVVEWTTRAVESGRGAIADWSRRWHGTRRDVVDALSGAAHTVHGMVEVLLGHRPARP
jgi:hypothetical protein